MAEVTELPEGDHHIGAEHHRRGTGGQAVQAVGEVHRVRRRRDDYPGEQREPDQTDREIGVADDRDERRPGQQAVGVLEPDRQQTERQGHRGLAGELRPRGEPEAALLTDFDVVVEEADHTQAGHDQQDQQSGRGESVHRDQMCNEIADQRRQDDDRATHRGGTTLGKMT